jgi:hypothetical protein
MIDKGRAALGAVVILLAAFTLMQASWLAGAPGGKPLLLAGQAVEPVRDAAGCITSAGSGYGTVSTGPDVTGLQTAAGSQASAVLIPTEMVGDQAMVGKAVARTCGSDKASGNESITTAIAALTKPERIWKVQGTAAAQSLLAALPAPSETARDAFLGDDAAVAAVKKARPDAWAFTVKSARACAADYRTTGLWGSVPASCTKGTMMLTVNELGYSLWGWPNRFLARMKAAGVHAIIAEAVAGDKITGLSVPARYGDIAHSYNGYIWIDNVGEMGPALVR